MFPFLKNNEREIDLKRDIAEMELQARKMELQARKDDAEKELQARKDDAEKELQARKDDHEYKIHQAKTRYASELIKECLKIKNDHLNNLSRMYLKTIEKGHYDEATVIREQMEKIYEEETGKFFTDFLLTQSNGSYLPHNEDRHKLIGGKPRRVEQID